jgi:hypothetical protein
MTNEDLALQRIERHVQLLKEIEEAYHFGPIRLTEMYYGPECYSEIYGIGE